MPTVENTTLSYTNAHHTNSQQINSEISTTTQLPYIQLALHVISPKTLALHLI